MTREELDALELADQEALRERRLILRSFADELMATLLEIPKPKSYLDIGRALRATEATDRTLRQLYSQPRRRMPRPKTETAPGRKADSAPSSAGPAPKPVQPSPMAAEATAVPARQANARPVKTSSRAKPDVAALMQTLRRSDTAIGRAYAGAPAWTNPRLSDASP